MKLKILEDRELDVVMMEACKQDLPAGSRGACRIIAQAQAKLTAEQIVEMAEMLERRIEYARMMGQLDIINSLPGDTKEWQALRELFDND